LQLIDYHVSFEIMYNMLFSLFNNPTFVVSLLCQQQLEGNRQTAWMTGIVGDPSCIWMGRRGAVVDDDDDICWDLFNDLFLIPSVRPVLFIISVTRLYNLKSFLKIKKRSGWHDEKISLCWLYSISWHQAEDLTVIELNLHIYVLFVCALYDTFRTK